MGNGPKRASLKANPGEEAARRPRGALAQDPRALTAGQGGVDPLQRALRARGERLRGLPPVGRGALAAARPRDAAARRRRGGAERGDLRLPPGPLLGGFVHGW